MAATIGIDINGLSDVSARPKESVPGVYRGGDVPSVVVLPTEDDGGRYGLTVIAGDEASRGIEGRGWQWPESACVVDGRSRRIPVAWLLEALRTGKPVKIPSGEGNAQDLLGATIKALAGPDAQDPDAGVVIAIPDDRMYSDEIRQRLLDSAANHAISATLLWRSVAAFLGLEEQLRPVANRLKGRKVGVLSLMNEGVQVNCLDVDVADAGADVPYLVPVRRGPGKLVPYRTPILRLADQVARSLMPDDPSGAWQVLWGDGLVLRWLLGLGKRPSLVQSLDGWKLLGGRPPKGLPPLDVDDQAIQEILSFLGDTRYVIYEGPALAAPTSGKLELVYHLQGILQPEGKQSLTFANLQSHLAARGCVVYAQRRMAEQRTYYDYLPWMKLAVRKGTEPDFVPLVSHDARVVGGALREDRMDLGVSIPANASELKFYLLREGAVAPRYVSVDLPARPREPLPVSMTVRQRPAQGLAELVLEAADRGAGFPSIGVRWDRMEERPDYTEAGILEELRSSGAQVPPVIPHPCHAVMWTSFRSGRSLIDVVADLARDLQSSTVNLDKLKALAAHLGAFAPPKLLSGNQYTETERHRAVSSDGNLPTPTGALTAEILEGFDNVMAGLGKVVASSQSVRPVVRTIVRSTTWAFARCPTDVREHLYQIASTGVVPARTVYFYAMGRAFVSEGECKAFFRTLERDLGEPGSTRNYHLNGLFCLLSIRDHAAEWLTAEQAGLFLERARECLHREVTRHPPRLKNLTRICLKAMAALLRFRKVDPGFAAPDSTNLGGCCIRTLDLTIESCNSRRSFAVGNLANGAREWFFSAGNPNILSWDDGDDPENQDDPEEETQSE